jgi:hypothetical protein
MNPLDQIKQYANLIISIIILLMCAYGMWYLYHKGVENGIAEEQVKTVAVQKEYNEYKANNELQIAKQIRENELIKIEQDKKYAESKADYNRDTLLLSERLRDAASVLCGEEQPPMRVATEVGSTVSTKADSSTRVTKAVASATSTRPTFEYTDALEDTLQCSKLIDFVKLNLQ